jgi:hypothetical protein
LTRPGIVLLVLVLALAGAGGSAAADLSAYRGLGTWVDVYDRASWRNPERAVERLRERGVTTLYLETSSYRRAVDVERPDRVARFLDAAHAAGVRVVAWYLPSFANLRRDLRRSLAAVFFRSPSGARFDSFALDIEASVVKSVPLRNTRLLELSAGIRAAAGADYPLGAIIPAPYAMELLPRYWPGFPFRELAGTYDAFLPMAYFSYRTRDRAGAAHYVGRSIEIIREQVGDVPVHAIGGIANRIRLGQVRGFVAAACGEDAVGLSLYDFETMRPGWWGALAGFGACVR